MCFSRHYTLAQHASKPEEQNKNCHKTTSYTTSGGLDMSVLAALTLAYPGHWACSTFQPTLSAAPSSEQIINYAVHVAHRPADDKNNRLLLPFGWAPPLNPCVKVWRIYGPSLLTRWDAARKLPDLAGSYLITSNTYPGAYHFNPGRFGAASVWIPRYFPR